MSTQAKAAPEGGSHKRAMTSTTSPRRDDDLSPNLAAMKARNERLRALIEADRALQRQYAHARDFLADVEGYWGRDGYRPGPDDGTWRAGCPACRSKGVRTQEEWRLYPLWVTEADDPGRWDCYPSCNCLPESIAKELLVSRRHKLDRAIRALEDAA